MVCGCVVFWPHCVSPAPPKTMSNIAREDQLVHTRSDSMHRKEARAALDEAIILPGLMFFLCFRCCLPNWTCNCSAMRNV